MRGKGRSEEPKARVSASEGLAKIPGPDGARFAKVFEHGTLEVEIYAPRGRDLQTPHRRDEVYVVVSGRGTFVRDGERHPFGPGDFLFVRAGAEHRFEDFGDDLVVWVIFYGPDGGEEPDAKAGRNARAATRSASSTSDPTDTPR